MAKGGLVEVNLAKSRRTRVSGSKNDSSADNRRLVKNELVEGGTIELRRTKGGGSEDNCVRDGSSKGGLVEVNPSNSRQMPVGEGERDCGNVNDGTAEDALVEDDQATPKRAKGSRTAKDHRSTVRGRMAKTETTRIKDMRGYLRRRKPEKPPPGGWPKPPAHWPAGLRVDVCKPTCWLPEGWGQAVSTTSVSKLVIYVSPDGKRCYGRRDVERIVGRDLGPCKDPVRSLEWTYNWAKMAIQEGVNFKKEEMLFETASRLFANLTRNERDHLPKNASELHFAVVSARRTADEKGLRGIANVQAQLTAAGASPVWYVDETSLDSYRDLGLDAKVGGKLVPARNMALEDAARVNKPCVQLSDDISRWDFYLGPHIGQADLFAGNEAAKNAEHFRISPVAAARYLTAKMRSISAWGCEPAFSRPRLAGVFPLGNTGQSFAREAVSREHFILGDFFVSDLSPCRFDPRMTLKEDYDFTCTHLATHGSVYRANRMFVAAAHETNVGGAVDARDESGEKERANIRILQDKWPGVFAINGNRGGESTQVVMSWRRHKPTALTAAHACHAGDLD